MDLLRVLPVELYKKEEGVKCDCVEDEEATRGMDNGGGVFLWGLRDAWVANLWVWAWVRAAIFKTGLKVKK